MSASIHYFLIAICVAAMPISGLAKNRSTVEQVAAVLDQYHQAASRADAKTYLGLMADNSVFIGTDAKERWPKEAFTKFVEPYFNKGKGWTYVPKTRHIVITPDGNSAFFDELLDNEKYGECRSTGIVIKTPDGWKVAQYHLTFPMPNDIANDLIKQIKAFKQK